MSKIPIASPFPGMDPYLEAQDIWPDLHSRLANIFSEVLAPQLAPKYVAELHPEVLIERLWDDPPTVMLPDVAVVQPIAPSGGAAVAELVATPASFRSRVPTRVERRLTSLHIRHRERDKLVTVIEILSPVNKRPGKGREEYLEKRLEFIMRGVHLIEIDLLRKYPHMPMEDPVPQCDYLCTVFDRDDFENANLWCMHVRSPLPTLPVPLVRPDPSVTLNLQACLGLAYERARYDLRVNYTQPADPPLPQADAEWAKSLTQK